MKARVCALFILIVCFANSLYSQSDTLLHKLDEVGVSAAQNSSVAVAVPMQILELKKIEALPAVQLSDALKFMTGIVVKDYGGVGGIKTVSIRGLGSQHTAVAYDGMAFSDCQTGQIDLSRFTLNNVQSVSLCSGSSNDIFLPSRFLSSASLLNIKSLQPDFQDSKPLHLKFDLSGGSFGYWASSLLLENCLVRRKSDHQPLLTSSIYVNYMQSKGDYPFVIHYGDEGDSTSNEQRTNSDMRAINAEVNLFFHFNAHSKLALKAYYFYSQRGLPGPIILYNTHSAQRLWDRNAFIQVHYENYFTSKFAYQLNAKYNHSYQRYLDPEYLNDSRGVDYEYLQQEAYLSNAFLYKPHHLISLSLSNDLIYNVMESNSPFFSKPSRFSSLTAISALFDSKWVDIKAALLHTYTYNAVQQGDAADNFNKFSPTVNVTIRPWLSEHFFVRMFYKNIFRQPTFNDLYYRDAGSVNLEPENTHQVDLGVEYRKTFAKTMTLSASVDGYYNCVENKIVALPVRNLFYWSMFNLGKVEIGGLDAHISYSYQIIKSVGFEISANYAFQYAVDRTNPKQKVYNHQIPYTPRHAGSAIFSLTTQWIDVAYTLIVSGERYCQAQNNEANLMPAYTDHSLVLGHEFDLKKVALGLKIELLNLADKHYEVIRNYPMQGRSIRAKLTLRY